MTEKPAKQRLLVRQVARDREKATGNQWLDDNERCRDSAKIIEKIGEHWQAFSKRETLTGHLPLDHELREYRRTNAFGTVSLQSHIVINTTLSCVSIGTCIRSCRKP